jgi:hypothetical protein
MAQRSYQEDADESKRPINFEDAVSSLSTVVTSLLARVKDLEDTNTIRHLHYSYGYYIDKCLYPSVVELVSHLLQGIDFG